MASHGIDRTGAAGGTGTSSLLGAFAELTDPNADSVIYWDDSAGGFAWYTINSAAFRTAAGLGTTDSPQFTAVEVGAATDTTLARAAAGRLSVEGVAVVRGPASGTDHAVVRFDATTGDLVQNSSFVVDDSGNVSSFGGQLAFPATQNASAGANTLDDYEEGTWNPAIVIATPGDSSIVYSSQYGFYTKIGNVVTVYFNLQTSTFTWTSASGNISITGLPFTVKTTAGYTSTGPLLWSGITKANYTEHKAVVTEASGTSISLYASGSGQAFSADQVVSFPTGGAVVLIGQLTYLADA